jgi:hypothetical protein
MTEIVMVRRAMKEIPSGAKEFQDRLKVVPFDTALALVAVWSGISAIFSASVQARLFNDTMPEAIAMAFNLVYIIGGLAVVSGTGWAYRNVQLSGWILIFTSLLVRIFALWSYGGFNPFVTASIAQALLFGPACIIRIITLLKRQVVILVDTRELEETGEHSVPSISR